MYITDDYVSFATVIVLVLVGGVAQLAERRSLVAGELTLFYARAVADG